MFPKYRPPIDWNEISAKLKTKDALKPCPRCEKSKFTYVGEIDIPIELSGAHQVLPGPSYIPSIAITCDNCGYLMQHAIGILLGGK
jgi:hypothetical protein